MNKIQIPWEDRPVGCTDVMWRYSQNPVIGRYHIPSSNSIFNSAVVPFEPLGYVTERLFMFLAVIYPVFFYVSRVYA